MSKRFASLLILIGVVIISIGLLVLPQLEPNLFGLPNWAFRVVRIVAFAGITSAIIWSWRHGRFTKAEGRKPTSKTPPR